MILDQQEVSGQLDEEVRRKIREALLKQHHHQNQKKLSNRIPIVRSFADIGKKQSEPGSMDKNELQNLLLGIPATQVQNLQYQRGYVNITQSKFLSKNNNIFEHTVDLHFMKKIPPGAEASNILVGELDFLDRPVVAFVRLSPAVLLSGLAEVPIPTRFLFILLGPMGKGQQYHEIGRSIATLMTDEVFHDVAYKAKDRSDLVAGIDEFLDQVMVLPPGEWDPSIRIEPPKNVPSQEKRKMPGVPNGMAGHGETAEPGGHEGPELQRTGRDYGLSYLSLRACIGLWTAFLCILLVATDASSLVCYITRFTEEAFAALICIIFIYEALEKLIHLGETYPFNMNIKLEKLTQYSCVCVEPPNPSNKTLQYWDQQNISVSNVSWGSLDVHDCIENRGEFLGSACGPHGPYVPDVLFWSIVLFFSTVTMSSFLKDFKTSRYFPTKVRSIISDFAVFITILTMVFVDYGLGVQTPKLQVPNEFKPTRDDRGWLVNPVGPNPWWTTLVTVIPALLCTILIFMDQQITAVIINRKEHKLKKGCGYHLDLFIVGVMLGVCSIMGLPWFVAATVLSISHVNSLKLESECSAPGEQPKFLGIREQRFTGLMIFVLMGSSVFMTSVLKFIPMPVLYGVFLYMGASSLKGIQVLALVFIRKLMDFIFTKRELSWLDDLMPESKKKKLEDAQKEEEQSMLAMEEEGIVHLPLEGSFKDDPSTVNISDEMAKTSVWKTLAMNTDNPKNKDVPSKRFLLFMYH
ncbi:S4A10 protein, partial [Polypterus senegalus]